ncbi:MAG: hypothetical protein RLZZ511_1488 [Cyanobacteriota bacterium]|jgi:3-hydroxyacyl-CoA dehydrogenase
MKSLALKSFRQVAVLGAGIMGSQIAAHLANAGLTVHLLDLPSDGPNKNKTVETAFKQALKLKPPMLFSETIARRITLGNYEEHFQRLAEVDWVIEAIVENLAVKQALMARIEATVRPNTIVSTNTSGLSVSKIVEGRSETFRRHFLGTHFFNPPRYLKLLELIPTPDTAPSVIARMQEFGQMRLGKGVILAKDTPNFIANRIGVFATMLGLRGLTQGYTIAEIDYLTGPLTGHPKSATFRTADLVGLDTLSLVLQNLQGAIPDDEQQSMFAVPPIMQQLVALGAIGSKVGSGFYQKLKGEILAFNPTTQSYEPSPPMDLGDIEAIAKLPRLGDRLRHLYQDPGRAGIYFRDSIQLLLAYCANRVPEIADDFRDLDRAMQWGFGWEIGPFAIWDELGFAAVLHDLEARNLAIPAWVNDRYNAGQIRFYNTSEARATVELAATNVNASTNAPTTTMLNTSPRTETNSTPAVIYLPSSLSDRPNVPSLSDRPEPPIDLEKIKADPTKVLWQNPEAALLDLGDGVALYEFRSKGNTLSLKVLEGLDEVMTLVERGEFRGLVIGNGSDHFSGGANLMEIAAMAQADAAQFGPAIATMPIQDLLDQSAIGHLIVRFQNLLNRLYSSPYPVVAAVQGRALGGGAELVMACPRVVAAAESYIGLVEVSVGLIPGAGGIMRMVSRATRRAASDAPNHILPFLRNAFQTIATARVSTSALEAQELGFLPADAIITMTGDRRLDIAKEEVRRLDREGYVPPAIEPVMLLGRPARAMLIYEAYIYQQSGYASDHDRYLATHLATVMTGGNLTAPTLVPESYLLQLERETFVPLLQQPKTQARIQAVLTTKKPLRN